jgi:lipopolysaccharide export system protein LptA
MRRTRWLFLAAILAILATVGATYIKRKERIARNAPEVPVPLETGVEGRASNWCYTQSDGDRPRVKVCAENFRQVKEPSLMELDGVELQLFHEDGTKFDLVKSAKAQFDVAGRSLYSDGEVDITMAVPTEGEPRGRLLRIRTSGVTFLSDSGKASTMRAATFEFDGGGGSAVGADYDPASRELRLNSQVALDWRGKTPAVKPMHIEAGEALYREGDAKVTLTPWSKLTRDTLHIDAGASVVTLENGAVKLAEVQSGRGLQDNPGRKVEFAADALTLNFGDAMVVRTIEGRQNAQLISTAATARTTVTADRLDLAFTAQERESILSSAVATGNSTAEAAPIPAPGAEPPETRVLKSQVIRLNMRPGGQEIDRVETDGPGTLDFLPNRPTQAKRTLNGDRIWIAYGAQNRIQSFRSVNVSTRTERPPQGGKPTPPATTQSKEILASFDPATSQLARVEQNTDFRYQEGDRQARGDRAILEQLKDVITLEGAARVWDPAGSATADRIVLEQKSGDYTAEGHVATTRQPDKKGASSAMLSNQEVMQARAQRMVSSGGNQHIHYEGSAVAWQGANRVEADRIDIDREHRVMEAHGKVVSQFVDKTPADAKTKTTAPVFTVVRAPDLRYTEETRVALYQGGVALARPDLTVASRELRAFLNDSSSDSSLDKAFAEGAVKIVSTRVDGKDKRVRTGTSEHSEYYAGEQKLILEGGEPQLVDSLKGKTTGKQLTWFANNDRLLVNGAESKPAESILRKK